MRIEVNLVCVRRPLRVGNRIVVRHHGEAEGSRQRRVGEPARERITRTHRRRRGIHLLAGIELQRTNCASAIRLEGNRAHRGPLAMLDGARIAIVDQVGDARHRHLRQQPREGRVPHRLKADHDVAVCAEIGLGEVLAVDLPVEERAEVDARHPAVRQQRRIDARRLGKRHAGFAALRPDRLDIDVDGLVERFRRQVQVVEDRPDLAAGRFVLVVIVDEMLLAVRAGRRQTIGRKRIRKRGTHLFARRNEALAVAALGEERRLLVAEPLEGDRVPVGAALKFADEIIAKRPQRLPADIQVVAGQITDGRQHAMQRRPQEVEVGLVERHVLVQRILLGRQDDATGPVRRDRVEVGEGLLDERKILGDHAVDRLVDARRPGAERRGRVDRAEEIIDLQAGGRAEVPEGRTFGQLHQRRIRMTDARGISLGTIGELRLLRLGEAGEIAFVPRMVTDELLRPVAERLPRTERICRDVADRRRDGHFDVCETTPGLVRNPDEVRRSRARPTHRMFARADQVVERRPAGRRLPDGPLVRLHAIHRQDDQFLRLGGKEHFRPKRRAIHAVGEVARSRHLRLHPRRMRQQAVFN